MNKKIIHSVFDETARKFPGKIAIRQGQKEVSYQVLRSVSDQLAAHLQKLGVGKDTKVMTFMPSCQELVISVLSIFKAGGIYMPIEKGFSLTRVQQVFEEAFDGYILTTEEELKAFIEMEAKMNIEQGHILIINGEKLYEYDRVRGVFSNLQQLQVSEGEFENSCDPHDSNYLFFTSGSTGKAKSILGKHISLGQFIHWQIQEFEIDETYMVSQLIQPTFDASLRDIFVPLCAGGTLAIPGPHIRANMAKLWEWIIQTNINLIHTVPSLYRLMLKEYPGKCNAVKELRYIILSGEPLFGKDITKSKEILGDEVELVNFYGCTETTLIRSFYRVDEEFSNEALVPVGKPIANTSIAIINDGRLCRPGEIGEVYIKTPFMSNGYYNAPNLNQLVFVQNPLVNDREDIVYKTGDLGRYRNDQNIEILGRLDKQVKINGIRIEVVEIEQAMLALPGVEEVFVKVNKTKDNQFELIAYFVGKEIEIGSLRDSLAKTINENIIPAHFLRLQAFPINLNGKIDTKSLPLPGKKNEADYKPPIGQVESLLQGLWQEILGSNKISRNVSFFEIGGHSLRAIRLISSIYRVFDVELKLTDVFNNKTIASLARLIESSEKRSVEKIEPTPRMEYYSLSPGQKRLWLLHQLEGAEGAYNISLTYQIKGKINQRALQGAFDATIKRHEILRTRFVPVKGQPYQQILDFDEINFLIEATDLPGASLDQVEQIVAQEENWTFDLSNENLFRVHLVNCEEFSVLILTMHHIVSDGWSLNVLSKEIIQQYNGMVTEQPVVLPILRIQYKDYAQWLSNKVGADSMNNHRQYWQAQFAGEVPILNMPSDLPRTLGKTYNGAEISHNFNKEITSRIYKLINKSGAGIFPVLLAAVKALLYRYTNQDDLIIGVPVSGRERYDLQDQLGFYVNTLAIRTRFQGSDSFLELIEKVSNSVIDGYDHQYYPFDQLVGELHLERDQSRSPLFDIMVDLRNEEESYELPRMRGLQVMPFGRTSNISKFDITFGFWQVDKQLGLKVEYNTDLYSAQWMKKVLGHFDQLLKQLFTHHSLPINSLKYLPAAEYRALTETVNVGRAIPVDIPVVKLFEKMVALYPGEVALIYKNRKITYSELNELSGRLSQSMVANFNVSPKDKIVILMERSSWMVVSVLAVFKAGATFVPVDVSAPAQRKNFICDDIKASVVLTDNVEDNREIQGLPVINVPKWGEDLAETTLVSTNVAMDDLAYVIYTSGSTGQPKGVMVDHKALASTLVAEVHHYNLDASLRTILTTNPTFDVSLLEIFLPLVCGGSVVIPSKDPSLEPGAVIQLINQYAVTMLQGSPSFISLLLDHLSAKTAGELCSLKHFCIGGESFNSELLARIQRLVPQALINNHYGPTEACIDAIIYSDIHSFDKNIIGKPMINTSIYILDEASQPVPVGVPGEICIAGPTLAKGYLRADELSNEKFVIINHLGDQRLYKTGDIGKWTSEGTIEFIGRKDSQIKLRGYRIEIGEIEKSFISHPSVSQVFIDLNKTSESEAYLIAYYMLKEDITSSELRAYIRSLLPPYMVPAYFVPLAEFPLTRHGKIDKVNLPGPGILADTDSQYTPPINDSQEVLVKQWQSILKKDRIGVNDNFYEMGGDSIKAIQIASRVYQCGYRLDVRDLLRYPTINELSHYMAEIKHEINQDSVIGEIPLSPIQVDFFKASYQFPQHHNQAVMLFAENGFDRNGLIKVFQKILNHHDLLRATFLQKEGEVKQFIHSEQVEVNVKIIELSEIEDPAKEMQSAANSVQGSINLEMGPLVKLCLFRHEKGDHLLIAIHHLVVDGISWRILIEDISTLYQQYLSGDDLILPAKTHSFREWTSKLQEYADSEAIKASRIYWQGVLKDDLPLAPRDFHDSPNTYAHTASLSLELDEIQTTNIKTKVHEAFNTRINDILISGLAMALGQTFDQETFAIALEGHGREPVAENIDVTRTIGWFTSIYPVILSRKNSIDEQIIGIKETLNRIPNKGVDFGILECLDKSKGEKPVDSPNVSFNYLGEFHLGDANGLFTTINGPIGNLHDPAENRDFDLEIDALIVNSRLKLNITYNEKHYDGHTMESLRDSYLEALISILQYCTNTKTSLKTPSDFVYNELSMEDMDTLFD